MECSEYMEKFKEKLVGLDLELIVLNPLSYFGTINIDDTDKKNHIYSVTNDGKVILPEFINLIRLEQMNASMSRDVPEKSG